MTDKREGVSASTAAAGSAELKYNQIEARVVADSFYVNPLTGEIHRLISLEGTMARYVLAEFNTHKMTSRNSASSRAIPTTKLIRRVLEHPYMPLEWGENKPGMSADEILSPAQQAWVKDIWLDQAARSAMGALAMINGFRNEDPQMRIILEKMAGLGPLPEGEDFPIVHKQVVNRLLEPFMYHTVLATATDWSNFFALRISKQAHPDIRVFAEKALEAIEDSQPQELAEGEYHMPYVDQTARRYRDYSPEDLRKVAVARSARLSYLNQEKHLEADTTAATRISEKLAETAAERGCEVSDIPAEQVTAIEEAAWNETIDGFIKADIQLCDNLIASGHMSPLEHVAQPFSTGDWEDVERIRAMLPAGHFQLRTLGYSGNFYGWHQYRKSIPHEDDYSHNIRKGEIIDRERIVRALGVSATQAGG